MSRVEKRRKFNEAVLNTLYPPCRPKEDEPEVSDYDHDASLNFNLFIPGDLEAARSSTSGSGDDNDVEDGHGNESRKLTRAQRKRVRRKKLKKTESCFERRKIIGPLLPSMETEGDKDEIDNGEIGIEPLAVRRNASQETSGVAALSSEAPCSCPNKSKVKQRRKAKKLAMASLLESRDENLSRNRSASLTPSYRENHDKDREIEKEN